MNIDELTPDQQSHVYDKIKELRDSPGWSMLKKIMANEIGAYYRKLSSPNTTITTDTINYHRGIIEGTYRLKDLPQTILDRLEADMKLRAASGAPENSSATSAMADRGE